MPPLDLLRQGPRRLFPWQEDPSEAIVQTSDLFGGWSERGPGPAYNTDRGGTGTNDPLVPDAGPHERVLPPTDSQPRRPVTATPATAYGGRYGPPSAMQAAGGMPSGFGAQPSSAPGPPGGAPSLTGQPSKGWWGRAKDYLNEPAFPRDEFGQEKPMSRGNLIGQMLMGAGQAIGTSSAGTGMLMAGLGGANQARQQARAAEEQRTQAATSNWYKRLTAQAALDKANKPTAGSTSEFERNVENLVRSGKITPERGQELLLERSQSLATENREPTTAEAAMLRAGVPPAEVFKLKNQPSEIELSRLRLSEEAGRRAEEAAARSGQQFNLANRRFDLQEERERRTAAEAAEGRALPERNRQLVNRVAEAVEGGGWETVAPEDRRSYNRVFREMATPRREIDPLTGNVTEIQPDVTDLPVPPGYGGAGAAPPKPGITQPGGVLGREQTQAARDARRLHDEGNQAIDRVNELLDQAGAGGRVAGDERARLDQAASSLISLLGQMGNSGVLQTGEVDRFKAELGGITGPAAAAGAAVGYDPARAALEELKVRLERHLQNRLPKVNSEEEALAMPPGVPFLMMPGSRPGMNGGG